MQRRRREKTRDGGDAVIKNLTELREGAPVVHIDHGVGRYLGLITLEVDNQQAEFLMLQYAEDAKLYVPVANLHLIARYTGADDALAPLHRLGSETWQKAKRKAAEQVRDVAAEPARHLRPPRRPRRLRVQGSAGRLRDLLGRLPVRGDAGPAKRHRGGGRRYARAQANGPPGLRRRRLRQDRSGDARGVRRRA